MLSFILLRRDLPNIERPYVSAMGTQGAWAALIIALITLLFLFLNPDYRVGVVGCAIWYGLAVIYFGVYARKYMVRSPEEEFALEELRKEAERRRGRG
jgi:ethanolamine permease